MVGGESCIQLELKKTAPVGMARSGICKCKFMMQKSLSSQPRWTLKRGGAKPKDKPGYIKKKTAEKNLGNSGWITKPEKTSKGPRDWIAGNNPWLKEEQVTGRLPN